VIGLAVAGLELWLDAVESGVPITLPECHELFAVPESSPAGLVLRVRGGSLPPTDGWRPLFSAAKSWHLYQDGAGRYVFEPARESLPRRHVTIDACFTQGEVLGEFDLPPAGGQATYPLQDLDLVIFANWLADLGDLILHASGVEVEGRGYCFAGESGAGKSTLAAALAEVPGVTVLGEDQVVLRLLGGRFWIFGTPWHVNPARCSPRGAPLDRLFLLDRSNGHGAWPLSPVDGIAGLLQTAFVPYYRPEAVSRILETLAHLPERVPMDGLSYEMGSDPAVLLRRV